MALAVQIACLVCAVQFSDAVHIAQHKQNPSQAVWPSPMAATWPVPNVQYGQNPRQAAWHAPMAVAWPASSEAMLPAPQKIVPAPMPGTGSAPIWAAMKSIRTQCLLQDRPDPTDNVKSISYMGLYNAIEKAVRLKSNGTFPPDYNTGIAISAGPPPLTPKSPYQERNLAGYDAKCGGTDEAAAQRCDALLQQKLNQIDGGKADWYFPATGVYEGCMEVSYIISVDDSIINRRALGEELRAEFFQDSFMWYEELQENADATCRGTTNKVRKFGLGYGSDHVPQEEDLGFMCQYNRPPSDADLPFACTIDEEKGVMWSDSNERYDPTDPTKHC